MKNQATTQGLQEKFQDITETYHKFLINSNLGENDSIFKLILAKILTNLSSANLLWSVGRCYDAFIILRSAFNSLILFEYLISFPDKVETYKIDSEIAQFKNVFGYFERGFLPIEGLTECYLVLSNKTKARLKLTIDPKTNILKFKLDKLKKSLEDQKLNRSLTQKMYKMRDELKKENRHNIDEIVNHWLTSWNKNSHITHGEFYTLTDNFIENNNENEKQLKLTDEIKECFRQSMGIIVYSMESVNSLVKDENNFKKSIWDKILIFYKYLGYDTNKLFKKGTDIQSGLIQVIRNPILFPNLSIS